MEYNEFAGQDTFKLYYLRVYEDSLIRRYLARSIDYGISWTDTQIVNVQDKTRGYEAIIKKPDSINMFLSFNRWISGKSYMYSEVSIVLVLRKMEFPFFDLGRSYCFSDFNSVVSCLL